MIRTRGAASIESDAPPGVLLNATKRTNLHIMKTYFKFACVYCGQHIECETTLSGGQIKCPACAKRIVIPAQEKGQPARKQPLTKFTWDTVVETPKVEGPKSGRK